MSLQSRVLAVDAFVSQVLDLGVIRMLVHRLVRVFPYLCDGKKPPAGSETATRRTAFLRLLRLHRRSKACRTPPGCVRDSIAPLSPSFCLSYLAAQNLGRAVERSLGSPPIPATVLCLTCVSVHAVNARFSLFFSSYIVRANEKQAVFTRRQHRDGVAILAFIVAGLFGPVGDADAGGAFAVEHEPERAAATAWTDVAGYEADGDEQATKVGRNFVFDWEAYHDVCGDTPIHVAVTSMFVECAMLFARIAGRTTSAAPPPIKMSEGLDIREQAKSFINKFVSPIFGHIASVKVHKLLCHVADAIKWHGNLQNCNTAAKESEHKTDKPHNDRTEKHAHTFTRQLVRHAHGSR